MTGYWDKHYRVFEESSPSPFCQSIIHDFLEPSDVLVELGCGNGRDGLALASATSLYVGVDLSARAIERANELFIRAGVPTDKYYLKVGDFSQVDFHELGAPRLVVYSRFSLHADTEEAENRLIKHLREYSAGPLLVCVEARTVHDELYGRGDEVARNTFVTDHFRRFIEPEEFRSKITPDFVVTHFAVERGFAPYRGEDPMVMRAVFAAGIAP